MPVFDIHKAENKFSELFEIVLGGGEVIITKMGRPVARFVPIQAETAPRTRKPGIDKGKVIIGPDFDDPLPEFDV